MATGVIHTFAERSLQINDETMSYTMDQTIEYDECVGDEADTDYTLNFMRLSLTETYLAYERDENILRFSMIGKVSPASGRQIGCHPHVLYLDLSAFMWNTVPINMQNFFSFGR